jgi:molecular chaperone HscA
MALFQISEPGESPAPHQRRIAIGIDLGTTHSLVASVSSGMPVVLNDEHGHGLLPSVVHYRADAPAEVGQAALAAAALDPRNTISSVKRFMGRGLKDVVNIENLPYDFVDAPGMLQLRTAAGIKSPVEVSADILRTLRQRAEAALLGGIEAFSAGELVGAVITVPAYFDDAQRQATKDAASLAGLNVLRLLNEPTAAAIAYGLENAAEGIYAVYDLGGGTFDISILRLSRGVFEVLATGGDSALGGDDFDHRLFCWALEAGQLPPLGPQDTRMLLTQAREVKEQLSSHQEARFHGQLSTGETFSIMATQAGFADITANLVAKTLQPTRRALRDAGLTVKDVKGVVMVGGATRMPHVQRAVAGLFGQPPLTNLDPDKVVALGAAMQADALAGNKSGQDDWLLLDVIPLSLGIETMGGLAEKIITRNATLPVSRAQEFTTYRDGQSAMAIHVVQGERELVADCRSLARFELRGIPPMVAGAARIRVTFQLEADGLLSVAAREMSTGVEAAVTVKPSYGLADDQIAQMLRDGFAQAENDMAARSLQEARVEAERMVLATRSALSADGALLEAGERADIEALVHRILQAAQGSDAQVIDQAVKALAEGTEAFAAARMNQGIRQALAGRRLEDI